MTRYMITLVAVLLWLPFTVQATDITIGATTQPNFNPSNLGAAVTITGVTVNNGANATLTCSSCFRPQWVGMSGFYVTVGLNNYYVKNVDSVSQVTLTGVCNESSPATVTWHSYVEFRIYADRAFQPLGKSYIVQPGTPGSGAWYKRYGVSIIAVNGIRTAYLPELVIDATTDAVGPTNQARYTAAFYRSDNSLIQVYACADQFRVPAVTPTSWTALCQFNSPPAIVPPANEAYTKTQIDSRLIPCSAGQMLYYAATGNQPTCLVVGTGLTITGNSILTTGGVAQAINIVTDYGCDPDDDGGSVDQTCFQNAINAAAAATGLSIYVPTGVYNVSGLTVPGGVRVYGDGRTKSLIKSSANATIVALVEGTGVNAFFGPSLRDIGIVGSLAAGTSQDGISATDNAYMFNVRVDSVNIQDTGGDGLFVGNTYSSWFSDLYITNTNEFPVHYNAPNMPGNLFSKIYVGNLTATKAIAYRVRGGEFTCLTCNGVNNVVAGSKWAVVGRKTGVDGDVANLAAKFSCTDCNLESWVGRGVLSYYGSVVSLRGTTKVQMDTTGNGTGKPLEFDLNENGTDYYAEFIERGVVEDSVTFTRFATAYANSEAIHANGFAPLQTLGTGPNIVTSGSLSRVNTFYNSTASGVRPLPRADGNAVKLTVTGTTSLSEPNGVRYIEANCSAACTITIPWPGWYRVGDTLTIKDISNNAAINNVSVIVSGGGTINGSATFTINRGKQAISLRPDNSSDWRIVGQTTVNSRQAINLLDFGCDPADNGNDDSACIVAAITAAQTTDQKTLYIPAGVYNTSVITVSMNNLKITGDGMMKSILKARAANQSVISLTGASFAYRMSIEDIGIVGPGQATGSTGHCVYINDSAGGQLSEFAFKRMRLTECREDGFNAYYLFNGVFEGNQTDSIGGHHYNLGAGNTVTLTGNYIHTVAADKAGFKLLGGQFTLIGNNGMAPNSPRTAKWGEFGSNSPASFFRGTLIGNNIEDMGDIGVLFKQASYGVFHGNIFTTRTTGSHIAVKFEYIDQEMGLFDTATNRLILQNESPANATWTQSYPIHSYRPPFMVFGATTGSGAFKYYDTALTAVRSLPAWYAANDTTEGDVFTKMSYLAADTLRLGANAIDGQIALLNAANSNRLYLKAGSTAATTTFILPTGVPAGNDYTLKASTAGVWSWNPITGTGSSVMANSPSLVSPILNTFTFATLPATPTLGMTFFCTNCKPHSSTQVCELQTGGPGAIVTGNGTNWICH